MTFDRSVIPFSVSLEGPDACAIVEALLRAAWIPTGPPRRLTVDFERQTSPSEDLLSLARRASRQVSAFYESANLAFVDKPRLVKAGATHAQGTTREVAIVDILQALAEIPFEIATFADFYLEWGQPGPDAHAYRNPTFGEGHDPLGWAAAFRGTGHDRLVSRHWLEGGPFKVWRGPGDVSLVQFHALDADATTALEQARPGHAELGITDDTGFVQHHFVYKHTLHGLYEAATRMMKVVVLGRELSRREMLEWAAAKKEHKLGAGAPVDDVAFVFPVEAEARAHLPLLWRYGHQVWAIRNGVEVRLDADYVPPDTTPAWARAPSAP